MTTTRNVPARPARTGFFAPLFSAALLLATLSFATSAAAGQNRRPYAERHFESPEAVAALHERVKTVAYRHCANEYFKARNLKMRRACVAQTQQELLESIGDRRLYAVADVRNHAES